MNVDGENWSSFVHLNTEWTNHYAQELKENFT